MAKKPCIFIIAGVNGAGKSSVAGAAVREQGADYYNPDEATRAILERNPRATLEQANVAAWNQGRRLLEKAIEERKSFAFETTLGGRTITALLQRALDEGLEVRIWYVGLEGVELHLERVRQRVAGGGHDIPADRIRARYDNSRKNVLRLLPRLTELRMYDNSPEANPAGGIPPQPRLILHVSPDGVEPCPLDEVPDWSKSIVMAALKHSMNR